jgi:20S proteasome subunit beta 2
MWDQQRATDMEGADLLARTDLCRRNAYLNAQGVVPKMAKKTGTTITGLIYKDGVVLGADTRSTNGDTVADKNCEKIHYIAPNVYCCGAGTAADTEAVTGMVSSQMELHRLATGRDSRVVTALSLLKSHLFKYQGQVSAALVLGGYDCNGPHLFTVYPHGSTDALPYVTMGSGSLAAMAVFEQGYKEGLTLEDAKLLVARSIRAGIFNDLGSGSNVDLCVINKEGKTYLRNYECPNERTYASTKGFHFAPGTTPVVKKDMITATCNFKLADFVSVTEGAPQDDSMDTA